MRTQCGRELLLIHIPKTAGVSITEVVGKPDGVPDNVTHGCAAGWCSYLGPERFRNAVRFAVVRHPFDRVRSAWHFLRSQTESHRYWTHDARERAYIFQFGDTFDDFVRNMPDRLPRDFRNAVHFVCQAYWLMVTSNTLGVEHVLRFENLAEDWQRFARKYGLPEVLPEVNGTPGEKPLLTQETREILTRRYADDFSMLKELYSATP